MLTRRTGLTLSAAALAAAASSAARPARAAESAHLASVPLSRMDLPWWADRFAKKRAEIAQGPYDLAFFGDSITQDFEQHGPPAWKDFAPAWAEFYGRRRAINLGFSGDATCHLLWRIENGETERLGARAAVVLIGANNFGKLHWPAEPSFAGVEAIIAALRARLPAAQILLLGVLPSIRSPWVDAQTQAINTMMAARYGGNAVPQVSFQNLAPIFMAGGKVNPDAFMDPQLTPPAPPLHPNAASARRMLAAIDPWVRRTLG